MNTTIILSQIFGPLMLVIGLLMFLRPKLIRELLEFYETKSTMAFFVLGIVFLVLALSLLQYHTLWDSLADIIISLIIWIFLVRGVLLVFFPDLIHVFSYILLKHQGYMYLGMIIMIITWGYLTKVGFAF